MNKLLWGLTSQSALVFSVLSLLMSTKSAKAQSIEIDIQPQDRTLATTNPVSSEDNLACVKHPHIANFVCAKANQFKGIDKGREQIDLADHGDKELLAITDAESELAIRLFGCDCPTSVNCVRQLRDKLP